MNNSIMYSVQSPTMTSRSIKSRISAKTTRRNSEGLQYLISGPSLFLAFALSVSAATAAPPITPSGLNTQVSAPITLPSGQTQYNITGGTRPGGGANLFHSFGEFNVPTNNVANLLNNTALPTTNILGRVTGGNISNMFGTLQTTGFGNANVLLMNPAGFVFGPNASLNVGGSVAFTSADYLRLADGARFNAFPSAAADALISASPVAAFGFLGSNPAAITVQGSQLTVAEGAALSLVGGNITVEGGRLTAPSGNINLLSLGKLSRPHATGEVGVVGSGQNAGVTSTGFATSGSITISQGSTVSVSNLGANLNPPGKVLIRGGELVIDHSTVNAGAVDNHPGTVEVTAEHVVLNQSAVVANAGGHSEGGNVVFTVDSLSATGSTISADALVRGGESGGKVDITAGTNIHLTATEVSTRANTDHGGSINMSAPVISMNGSTVDVSTCCEGGFAGGTISLTATHAVALANGTLITAGSRANSAAVSPAGTILINGGQLFTAQQSTISATSLLGGTIQLQAHRVVLTDSLLTTSSLPTFNPNAVGGVITVNAKNLRIKNSQILSTSNAGQGGTIDITTQVLHQDASSVMDTSSQLGPNGTVTINGNIVPSP